MTHAESQDLLLDLAYGELDAARAAEVEKHLSSCPECRKEKAALEEARRMAAPVRELEEPPPGFDDRILRAARAQAQLEHDGNVGQVIEVTGTVRPLGVEAARIDAHGPVKPRAAERPRQRWVLRTAVAGSVAAAAALALVVSNTLETRRNAEKAAAARSGEFEIHVQPAAPRALDSGLREGEAKQRDKDQVEVNGVEGAAPSAPPQKTDDAVAQLPPLRTRAPSRLQGSGGDAAELQARPAAKKGNAPLSEPAPPVHAAEPSPGAPAVAARQGTAPAAMKAESPAKVGGVAASSGAFGVEANAQQARHAGNYVVAASLYREAAAARQREGDVSTAAWNLAHAVECLSAAGQFDEAKKVRDELARLYPSETTALSAAHRALREVDVPAASKASGDPQR